MEGRKRGQIRVEWTQIDCGLVDLSNWKADLRDTYKKSHKKADMEGRKSGRIDSIQVEWT